ncbi:hypothetical protein AB0D84_22745, partial [Streptomyces sp. NPDC048193]
MFVQVSAGELGWFGRMGTLPLLGRLTDKVGRRPVYLAAALLNLVLVVPAFKAIETGDTAVIVAL